MKGAINIIKGWREICKERTISVGKHTKAHKCKNCILHDYCCCVFPEERTDKDILDLVNKIGGVTR